MKIIVAGGNVVTKYTLHQFATQMGHTCRVVSKGAEVLNLLDQDEVDVVVLDFNLPMLIGAELLKNIRTRYPGVYVIIRSGYTQVANILDALNFRPFSCFPRLLDLNKFKQVINQLESDKNASIVENHC